MRCLYPRPGIKSTLDLVFVWKFFQSITSVSWTPSATFAINSPSFRLKRKFLFQNQHFAGTMLAFEPFGIGP